MMTHPAALPIEELLKQCRVRAQRRSGPGGQHRNKVETAVVITHLPSNVSGEASERRSREANRQQAIDRLRVNLALQLRLEGSSRSEPSELWRARCRRGRISINPSHEDFPAMLAEALDWIAAANWELKHTAEQLQCTPSQLLKFIKADPRAITLVNFARVAAGLHPYK